MQDRRSLLGRIWDTLTGFARRRWSYSVADPQAGTLFRSTASTAGVDVDQESSLSLSGVFAAVQLLSSVVGMLPLYVYRTGQGGRRERADSTAAAWLLGHEPNPEMTAITFRATLEVHRLLWGSCYAEIEWAANGQPAAIWPVGPWRVRPYRLPDWSLAYQIDGSRTVHPGDMLVCHLISWDGVAGRSFLDYAAESLGLGLAAQTYAAAFFGNGARPGLVLTHPGMPTAENRAEIRKGWQERHQGPAKAGGMGMLWGGWQMATDSSMTPEASQLIEQRRFSIEEVARWLNIPPHLLRELSRATFSNIEHQGIDFATYTLGPVLTRYEQEVNRKLLSPPRSYCEHDLTRLVRGDMAARSAFYSSMRNIGVLNTNEIRAELGLNPIEGGDEYWVPANMVLLSDAIAAEEQQDQQQNTEPGGVEDEVPVDAAPAEAMPIDQPPTEVQQQ